MGLWNEDINLEITNDYNNLSTSPILLLLIIN